jgi:internalin A
MKRWAWAVGLALTLAGGLRAAEEAAVKAVAKLGGTVERDDKAPGNPVIAVNLTGWKVTNKDLKHLAAFEQLRSLDLNNSWVTDAGLMELARLRRLKDLDLQSTAVTDAGLMEPEGHPQLRTLYLFGTGGHGRGHHRPAQGAAGL